MARRDTKSRRRAELTDGTSKPAPAREAADEVVSLTPARLRKLMSERRWHEMLEEIDRAIDTMPQDDAFVKWLSQNRRAAPEFTEGYVIRAYAPLAPDETDAARGNFDLELELGILQELGVTRGAKLVNILRGGHESDLVSERSVQDRRVPGEATTPDGAAGLPRPRSALPAPEDGHGLTRPNLSVAAAAILAQPRAQPVIALLERDPDALIRVADEILRRLEQNAPSAESSVTVVTREMLEQSAPISLLADGRRKYDFSPELFDDPDVIKRERSLASKRRYKIENNKPMTEADDQRGRMAAAFMGKLQRLGNG